ncbi:MAG: SiaB family protein kinase [Bacteroidales bacterium]
MELIKKLRDKLLNEHLMFAYRGEVTGDNSVALLSLLEKEMELSAFSLLGRKRLFMFVLENLQNITRHGSTARDEVTSLVVYNKTPDGYTVSTGNVLKKREVKGLRQNLEKINSLDPESIREVYKAMLQDSSIGHKGGAGLGLIEMARKTGNKLDYSFLPIDESYSYFILSKTVDAGGHGINRPETDAPFDGQKIAQLEHMMKANNIYFIWAGVMSHAISKELLNFSETTMLEAELEHNLHKRVFATLIELLQNVTQHSPGFEAEKNYGVPVAMIRKTSSSYIITSGNLIRKSDMDHLRQKLDLVNNYDEEGLKSLLKVALEGQDMTQISTGYMGLLEMARRSGQKLRYTFDEVNEDYAYYVLTVRVRAKGLKAH